MTKFWRPFITLTIVDDKTYEETSGVLYLDTNSRMTLVRNNDKNYTLIVVGDSQGYYVKETPEYINDFVLKQVEEQKKEQAEEEERLRKEWEERAKEFEGMSKNV